MDPMADGLMHDSIPPTLHERLKAETRHHHEELERTLNLLRDDFNRYDYCRLLVRYYGFHASFERLMAEKAGRDSLLAGFYGESRKKTAWLSGDLMTLGADVVLDKTCIPTERLAALYPDEAHLLGAIYVIEGSMLGGVVLKKHLGDLPWFDQKTGIRYFTGYGAATREKWLATLQLLERFEQQTGQGSSVIEGARRTFLLLREHLGSGSTEVSEVLCAEVGLKNLRVVRW